MNIAPYPRALLEAMAANPCLSSLWERVPEILQEDVWPDCAYWQSRAASLEAWPQSLRFCVEQRIGQRRRRNLAKAKLNPLHPTIRPYETAICEAAEIPSRQADLHDYFNALIWLSFPRAKMALHKATWLSYKNGEQQRLRHSRSPIADALTRFDEGGMIYFSRADEDLTGIHELFQSYDDAAKLDFYKGRVQRFAVFGHGLLEAWCQGRRGFTASLLIVHDSDKLGYEGRDLASAETLASLGNPVGVFGTASFDSWLSY